MTRLILLAAPFLCIAASAGTPTADDQARFIAGMLPSGSELAARAENSRAWHDHAAEFDEAWKALKSKQLDAISTWADGHIARSQKSDGPLYYMFSGPDFLYAHAFFPRAPVYILCGTEPVGAVPDVAGMSEGEMNHALDSIHQSLNSVLSFSFFITKNMKSDLVQSKLTGTLPLLYVFLARSGCTLRDVELIGLDKEGVFMTGKSSTPGVRINFTGSEGGLQTLFYFTTDLSNWGIKDNPGFMKFCEAQGVGTAFAKAASYLMHMDEFTTVRDFLLSHTSRIVQDDSGIPLRAIPSDKWMVFGYGRYVGPIDLFKERHQEEAVRLFRDAQEGDLPFHFGYRWRPGESSLIYAVSLEHVPKAATAK